MLTNLEQCPLCGSELSQTKFREIRAKQREQDERKAAELAEAKLGAAREVEQEFTKKLEQQVRLAHNKGRQEAEEKVRKAVAEAESLAAKLKAADDREAEVRRQAQLEILKHKQATEKKAQEEIQQQTKKAIAERDLLTKKLKNADEREAKSRKLIEEQAKKESEKQLLEQRQALEKDRSLALLKQEAAHNRDRDSLQKKVKILEHQLQNRTANQLGDGGEIDLLEALRDAFQGDRINRIQKGQPGADILHEILYKGEVCGRIVLDSKNRQAWQNTFVGKLRQDQVEAKAEHAILATTAFPADKKELCIESGIIVVSPARAIYVVEILRQAMITMHIKGLSFNERSSKMSQLYNLITSEPYIRKFTEAERLAQDILDLDVQEERAHGIMWRKRGMAATRIKNVLREVQTEVATVVEGEDAGSKATVATGARIAL